MEVIIKHKVDGVLIDPYNQLIHDRQGNRDDLYLEVFLNKMKRFAQNQDIFFIICAHPNKPIKSGTNKVYEEPTAYDLAGGAMWFNKVDNILCFHRPNIFVDPKDTWCTLSSQKIKKQKLNGIPGKINFVYDRFKSRYFELSQEPSGGDIGFSPIEKTSHITPEKEDALAPHIRPYMAQGVRDYTVPIKEEDDDIGF
jgi:hypothetical protein